jgi:hypothetical protein
VTGLVLLTWASVQSHLFPLVIFTHFIPFMLFLFLILAFALFPLGKHKHSLSLSTCEISVSLGLLRWRADHAQTQVKGKKKKT